MNKLSKEIVCKKLVLNNLQSMNNAAIEPYIKMGVFCILFFANHKGEEDV